MRRAQPFCVLATALALACATPPARAQVSTVADGNNRYVKTLQFFGDQGPLATEVIFVVPANRSFRVTDLIVVANGSTNCLVVLNGKTAEMLVETGTMEKIQFTSGPTFGPGEPVVLGNNSRIGNGNSCSMTYTVMGYIFRPK